MFLDLEPDVQDVDAKAFDRLGFPYPHDHYARDLVRKLMLDLERRTETGELVRKWLDGDEETRREASERMVQEIAGGISASFVGPWP